MNPKKLAREQLDDKLRQLRPFLSFSSPPKGWVRAIRDALGMSGRQLAIRSGLIQQGIASIERGEIEGSVTMNTLKRVSEALDCVFVYGIVPKTSLEEIVKNRAKHIATRTIDHISHSMKLEHQELGKRELQKALDSEIGKLVNEMPRMLWEEK